jgi:hypothetical protein
MERFRDLIANMPVREQAFTSKKETWEKYIFELLGIEDFIVDIFGNNKSVEISRYDLFKLGEGGNMKQFVFATVIWGYPAGMRGRHFQSLFQSMNKIEENLISCRGKNIENWNEHYRLVAPIEGLGLSTYTKFLYFLKTTVNNLPALILDQRLIDVFRKGIFHECRDMKKIRYGNAPELYPKYLRMMAYIANNYRVSSENLEMFLFEFGANLKFISS